MARRRVSRLALWPFWQLENVAGPVGEPALAAETLASPLRRHAGRGTDRTRTGRAAYPLGGHSSSSCWVQCVRHGESPGRSTAREGWERNVGEMGVTTASCTQRPNYLTLPRTHAWSGGTYQGSSPVPRSTRKRSRSSAALPGDGPSSDARSTGSGVDGTGSVAHSVIRIATARWCGMKRSAARRGPNPSVVTLIPGPYITSTHLTPSRTRPL